MIQVIERAIGILEEIAKPPERPKSAGEIVQATKLHVATCVRILKTLASRGLVEQAGPKQGYSLGPSLYAMVARSPYRRDLVDAVQVPTCHLAQTLREAVTVNILHQNRLIRVFGIDGQQSIQVSAAVIEKGDPYTRCTGRILLSHLTPAQLDLHIQRCGMPGDRWPGVTTRADLDRKLAAVRTKLILDDINEDLAALACPIMQGLHAVAAIGIYLPTQRFTGRHRAQIIELLPRAAREASTLLESAHSSICHKESRYVVQGTRQEPRL